MASITIFTMVVYNYIYKWIERVICNVTIKCANVNRKIIDGELMLRNVFETMTMSLHIALSAMFRIEGTAKHQMFV